MRQDETGGRLEAAGPNAAMIEHWNDVVGPGWVAVQEELDAHLAPIGARAVEAAAAREGERVLDVGCGCGASTLALARAVGPTGRVAGVDLSAPMLARARERADAEGLTNVTFSNADAQTADLGGPFDLVFSRFGVMFFQDPTAAFANLRGALAPGGRLRFVCWQPFEHNAWMGVPMRAAGAHVEVGPPPPPGAPGPYGLADADLVRRVLAEAGFEDVRIDSLELALPVRGGVGAEESADFCMRIGPVAAALRQSGADETVRAKVHAAVRDAMGPFEKDGRVLLDAACWQVSARSPAS